MVPRNGSLIFSSLSLPRFHPNNSSFRKNFQKLKCLSQVQLKRFTLTLEGIPSEQWPNVDSTGHGHWGEGIITTGCKTRVVVTVVLSLQSGNQLVVVVVFSLHSIIITWPTKSING